MWPLLGRGLIWVGSALGLYWFAYNRDVRVEVNKSGSTNNVPPGTGATGTPKPANDDPPEPQVIAPMTIIVALAGLALFFYLWRHSK